MFGAAAIEQGHVRSARVLIALVVLSMLAAADGGPSVADGQVTFVGSPERAPLTRYAWCETCNLGMRLTLRDTLLHELHAVAPELDDEALLKTGNYQFSFFVDGRQVYVENLQVGAGTPEGKRTLTTFRVPLISTANEDSWGRFLWARFMLRGGGDDALSEGSHRLRIEVRPYVKKAVGERIAQGELTVTVSRPLIEERRVAVQKRPAPADFAVSKAPFDAAPVRELNRQIAQKVFKDITSLVVLRDGQLALEEYFNGATRETLHDTRSVGKSFVSALTGLALRDGHLKSVEQPLSDFYPGLPAQKAAITVRDLLTMSSGFDGDDSDDDSPGNEEKMYPTDDWVKFALSVPMKADAKRGVDWSYFTAGVVLLGEVLDRSIPGGLEKFADRELFKPLGIVRYQWQRTPKKTINTAGGLGMRSLDLAKLGQLYVNRGHFNGKSVLPESWVDASLKKSVTRPEGGGYGYLWWNTTYAVDGATFDAMNASGNGGNKIFVFADQHLVVVVTATAYNQPFAHSQVDKLMQRFVLPAFSSPRRAAQGRAGEQPGADRDAGQL